MTTLLLVARLLVATAREVYVARRILRASRAPDLPRLVALKRRSADLVDRCWSLRMRAVHGGPRP